MSGHDPEWWKARATKRYRQAQTLHDNVTAALAKHDGCWPDDPCSELAHDIREAIGKRP